EEALLLADRYRDEAAVARAFELAWAHHQVEHRHHPAAVAEAVLFQRLAGRLLYAGPALRSGLIALSPAPRAGERSMRLGVPSDRPIVTATIAADDEVPLARQLLAARSYLGARALDFELVL